MRASAVFPVVMAVLAGAALAGCSRPADTERLEDPSKQTLESPRSADQQSALRNRLATTQRDN